jgi:two-component system alkaline phosphatase synthesis response regulator PhoP
MPQRVVANSVEWLMRAAEAVEDTTVIGYMTIDRLRRIVTVKGQLRPIKTRDFALLETLARRRGIAFSRERCLTLAWPDTDAINGTVDVHVARLRRIFGRDTVNIRTVPGVGYAIDPPTDE